MILSWRDRQICRLLLQGYDNPAIAKELKVSHRTVKAHLNKMFFRFGIRHGVKRIKLAVLLYRRSPEWLTIGAEGGILQFATGSSCDLSLPDSLTKKSPASGERLKTSSKIISESSTTKSASGTDSNWLYGMNEIRALQERVKALERATEKILARVKTLERKLASWARNNR